MKQHVTITPQRVGFPCPFCTTESDQQPSETSRSNLSGDKNPDDYLFLPTYESLKVHCQEAHPNFNIDGYFICQQCGQVFQNRYKLSCHLFNVHSGKRKSRARKTSTDPGGTGKNKLTDETLVDYHMTSVIDSVASIGFLGWRGASDLRINCVVCQKSFKRVRDLDSHVKIMHKSLTAGQRQQQDILVAEHENTLRLNSKNSQPLQLQQQHINGLQKHTRTCFICNKVFREASAEPSLSNGNNSVTTTNNLNKTFSRHMQIQHGLNERGERLIECPVCEKNFFNRQQMERHMHTHEIWVPVDTSSSKDTTELQVTHTSSDSNKSKNMPDYRDRHSILYCHECTECRLFYKSIKVLTAHKKVQHQLRPVYKCCHAQCGIEFSGVGEFLTHAQLHLQKNIVCARCQLKFSNKNLLRHHMKNVHYNRKQASNNSATSKAISMNAEKG